MAPDRWRLAKELVDEALDLAPAERAAFLDRACDGDDDLRAEVGSLVTSCEASDGDAELLEAPAIHALLGPRRDDGPEALVGARAGGYRLTEVIASGGMGTVYRAARDDGEFESAVAVKVLKRGLDTSELLVRFATERRTLARLRHANVVSLLDAGSLPDGRPFFVMELVDGASIDRHCAERGLPLDARVRLFREACGAVEHAHRNLVVHRDLKPTHVLVTPGGAPKLLDFGVAKILSADDAATRAGSAAPMTPRYASPEQRRGEPVTTATDVYALGVMLAELTEGAAPGAKRRAIGAIASKAAHDEPARRYASAAELSEDLRRFLEGEAISATPDTLRSTLARVARRHRAGAAAAAAIAAALITAVVAMSVGLSRARAAETLAWKAHAQALAAASFLEDVLSTGDLDAAARRIDADLEGQPEAIGRAHAAVAQQLVRLGRRADAAPHAHAALELARTTRGFGARDVERYEALVKTTEK